MVNENGSITLDRHEVVRLANREYRRLCQEAIRVQNACNLSGVLKSAYDAACSLRACLNHGLGASTLDVNRHFVMQLFASKIADLSGVDHKWPVAAEQEAIAVCRRFDSEGNRT